MIERQYLAADHLVRIYENEAYDGVDEGVIFRIREREFQLCNDARESGVPLHHGTDAELRPALCFKVGQGVEQDEAHAAELYEESVASGEVRAKFKLGSVWHEGRGVSVDTAKVARLYQRSVDAGESAAVVPLSLLCEDGLVDAHDWANALLLLNFPCRMDVDACYAAQRIVVRLIVLRIWSLLAPLTPTHFSALAPAASRHCLAPILIGNDSIEKDRASSYEGSLAGRHIFYEQLCCCRFRSDFYLLRRFFVRR